MRPGRALYVYNKPQIVPSVCCLHALDCSQGTFRGSGRQISIRVQNPEGLPSPYHNLDCYPSPQPIPVTSRVVQACGQRDDFTDSLPVGTLKNQSETSGRESVWTRNLFLFVCGVRMCALSLSPYLLVAIAHTGDTILSSCNKKKAHPLFHTLHQALV